MSKKIAALILAAGKGTRMKSQKPKVLFTILGETMLNLVHHSLNPLFSDDIYTLIGYEAQKVKASLAQNAQAKTIYQEKLIGTANCLEVSLPYLENYDYVLITNGDVPLVSPADFSDFIAQAKNYELAFISLKLDDPIHYGRVVRDKNHKVQAIIEAKDYDEKKYGKATGEINTGIYLINLKLAKELLPLITNNNAANEYYLTDIISLALARNIEVFAHQSSNMHLLGVNNNSELLYMEESLQHEQINKLLAKGVILHNPSQIRISPLAQIEAGAEVFGPCEISGKTYIEKDVQINSHCIIIDSHISTGTIIKSFSHIEQAKISNNCLVGPYARLRPGSELLEESHIGNFVETKKAIIGKGSKANHLTYLGDTEVGANCNIGAGTITCNYDGKNKHKTTIGSNSFIGSNTALVAPIVIGENTLIGAGSTLSKNVPDDTLALTRAEAKYIKRKNKRDA